VAVGALAFVVVVGAEFVGFVVLGFEAGAFVAGFGEIAD
jgi:hypothetical protein